MDDFGTGLVGCNKIKKGVKARMAAHASCQSHNEEIIVDGVDFHVS